MPTKDRERMLIGGAVTVGLLVLLIGYFAFIGPQRGKTQNIDAQVADATTQNAVLSNKLSSLAQQNHDLTKYKAELAQKQQALPSTSALPEFLHTLQAIGTATGSDVSALTVAPPIDVTTGSEASSAAPAGLSVDGVHIYALPISAQVTGSVSALSNFVDQLQAVQPRAVLLSQVTETGTAGAKASQNTGLSLTMQAFVAPSDKSEAENLAARAHK